MGSLPDSKYIIQTDGYYFVESHDVDPSKGYITVSAKGVINGLSNQPNDGADFGPDSYNPNYSGSGIPYTQTSGIQEAWDYALSNIINYSEASSLYYIPEIRYIGGKYDIHETVTIEPPIQTINGKTYTIGNIIMKGQGSMNPYFINHVTTDYMFKLVATSSNVINTNIQVDNLQFQNAPSVTGYGHLSIVTPSGKNPFQSINLDVNGATSHAPVIVDGCNTIILFNYELYNNESSTQPGSIFQTNGVFSATGCTFNGDTIWAQNVISIDGSRVNYAGSSDYGIIIQNVSTVFPTIPVSQVSITNSYMVFPIGVGINIGRVLVSGSVLATAGSPAGMFIGISSGLTIESIIFKHNSVYEYSSGFALAPISSNLTVNEFRYDNIIGNTTLYSEILPTPTLSTNPPTSGTVYQNTNPYDIRIYLPAYASTSGTAGTVVIALGSSSSPSTIGTRYISGSTSSSSTDILELVVPAGWYYEYTLTGVTLATATVVAD